MKQLQEEGKGVAKTKEQIAEEEEAERKKKLRDQQDQASGMGFWGYVLMALVAVAFIGFGIMGSEKGKEWLEGIFGKDFVKTANDWTWGFISNSKPPRTDLDKYLVGTPKELIDVIDGNWKDFVAVLKEAGVEPDLQKLTQNGEAAKLLLGNEKVIKGLLTHKDLAPKLIDAIAASKTDPEKSLLLAKKDELIKAFKYIDTSGKHTFNYAALANELKAATPANINEVLTKTVLDLLPTEVRNQMAEITGASIKALLDSTQDAAALKASLTAIIPANKMTPERIEQLAKFIAQHRDDLKKAFPNGNGLDELAALIRTGKYPENPADIMKLMQSDDARGLRTKLFENAKTGDDVEQAISRLIRNGKTHIVGENVETRKAGAELAAVAIIAKADEQVKGLTGSTNFDVLGELNSTNPKAFEAMLFLLANPKPEPTASLESRKAYDAEFKKIASSLTPNDITALEAAQKKLNMDTAAIRTAATPFIEQGVRAKLSVLPKWLGKTVTDAAVRTTIEQTVPTAEEAEAEPLGTKGGMDALVGEIMAPQIAALKTKQSGVAIQ